VTANCSIARRIIDLVRDLGVSDFCVCSGSRNAPLLAVLATIPDIRLHPFVDERGAAILTELCQVWWSDPFPIATAADS